MPRRLRAIFSNDNSNNDNNGTGDGTGESGRNSQNSFQNAPEVIATWPTSARTAYRTLQEEHVKLTDEINALRRQMTDFENHPSKRKRTERGQQLIIEEPGRSQVIIRGQMFMVFQELWIPSHSILCQKIEEMPSETHQQKQLKALVENYRKVLPSAYRDSYFEKRVAATFTNGMGATRSNMISKLLNGANRRVFGREISEMLEEHRDEPNDELLALQGFRDGTFDILAPFLYKDGYDGDDDYLFNNVILCRALRCCLFGPSSLRPDSRPGEDTLGKNWQVSEVTPGAMAFAATAVRYLLSRDTEFGMIGNLTNFDYIGAFRTYRELAEASMKTIRGRQIVRSWNDFVFRGAGLTDDTPPVEDLSPANDLLERLRARALADADEIALQDENQNGSAGNMSGSGSGAGSRTTPVTEESVSREGSCVE